MLEIANNLTNKGYRNNTNAISKLKMIYKGFLPYAQLVEYVTFLLENELLAYREYERRYRITEKGLRFFRLYSELRQMISSKQEDRIQDQYTFNDYRWTYKVTSFTINNPGSYDRHSPYSFI